MTLTPTTIGRFLLLMFAATVWAGACQRWHKALPPRAWRAPVWAVLLLVVAVLVEVISIVVGTALALDRWRLRAAGKPQALTGPQALLAEARASGAASPGLSRWPDPGDVVLVGASPEDPTRAWTSARSEFDPYAHATSETWERHEDTDGITHELHGGVDTAPGYQLPVQWVVARRRMATGLLSAN